MAALAHVLGRLADRDVRRVRLRRAREVDRGLREVQPRLRQADVLDRLRRRDRDEQRLRVGVADVLGREHDHAPHDEARVLAALEHRREVVDRRLHVARARRLDPGRDEVVVARRRPCRRRAAACAPRRRRGAPRARTPSARAVSTDSSRMFSALRASPPARVAISSSTSGGTSASSAAAPRRTTSTQRLDRVRLELVDLRAREQRRVHLEVRVLGRRADQRHEALLDAGQQRVLLRLVEAVDLVEEEDRPPAARAEPLARPLRAPRARSRPSPRPPRAPRTRRRSSARRSARASSCPSRAARRGSSTARGPARSRAAARGPARHVLLADEVVERRRPQPLRERRGRAEPAARGLAEEVTHAGSMLSVDERVERGLGRSARTSASPRGSRRCRTSSSSVLDVGAGRAVLDLATGTGEVAFRARAPGRGVTGDRHRRADAREGARAAPSEEGVDDHVRPRRRRVPAVRGRAASTSLVSNFGARLRARPRERRRRARRASPARAAGSASPPGSRTRSSASSTAASPRSRSRAARRTSGAARTTSRTCSATTSSSSSRTGRSGSRPTRARRSGSSSRSRRRR